MTLKLGSESPDFEPAMARYQHALRMRKAAKKRGDAGAVQFSEIAMYLAELEMIALGGSLQAAGVFVENRGKTTQRMLDAQAELASHGLWPL